MSLEQLLLLLLFLSLTYANAAGKHSCDESLLGENRKISQADISHTISNDNQENIKMCLAVFGKEQLNVEIAELLWKDLVKVYRMADDIPEDELQLLGWIAMGIPAKDFLNLSLSDIETISAFGKWRNLSKEQLVSLKQAIEYQWSYKGPSDLSGYDLAALGQVLCVFNTTQIAAIKPLAYKVAASEISNLINCPREIIKELAILATAKEAFGDASEWTAVQVAQIGCVIAGLDSVKVIPPDAFEGLPASSIQCLPSETLHAMSIDQLSHLSLSAINLLTYEQRSSLDYEQIKVIQGTVNSLSLVLSNGGYTCRSITWSTAVLMSYTKLTTLIISSMYSIL